MPTKAEVRAAGEWSGRERLTYAVLFILSLVVSAASAVLPPMTGIIAPLLGVPSDDWIGFIVTTFLVVSGIAAIPWAYLADRTTRRNLLIVSTFFWVFWFVPILLPTTSYWTLYLFYGIAAIGVGATGPLSLSITIDSVPVRWRSTTFGLLGTAAGAGYGLGYIISGLLVELLGWQTPFLVIIVVGVAAGLLLFLTKEPHRGQHDESLAELRAAGGAYTYRLKLSDIRRMWRKPSNIFLVLVGIVAIIPVASFGAWAVRWLNVDHSLGIFVATEFMTLALASQIAGNAVFGRLGDKLFRRDKRGRAKLILLCCVVACPILIAACVYPFAVAPTATIFDLLLNPATLIFFLLIFVGTFFDAGISPLIYVSAGDINPPEIRSTAMSLHLLAHVVGVSLGTQLTPSLAVAFFGGTYSPALALICLLFFGAAGLALLVLRHITGDIRVTDEDVKARAKKTRSS
jgi:MFS family permease